MTPERRRRLSKKGSDPYADMAGAFSVDITREEILDDLFYPGRAPGRWFDVASEPAAEIAARIAPLEREAA